MQSLLSIDLFKEHGQILLRIRKGVIVFKIHLLLLERLKEAFRLGMVIGISYGRHTDVRSDLLQLLHILSAGILHASIRMMDQSRLWLPFDDRLMQGASRKVRGHLAGQMPAHTAARKGIQDARQVHERTSQANRGKVGHPGLIGSRERQASSHIGIDGKSVTRIGRRDHKLLFEMAE